MRVFLVDDFTIVREALSNILTLFTNAEIVGEASNAQEAIETCHKVNPDIVIMDYSLPDMNGLETSQKILELCPSVKIIMLTANPVVPNHPSLEGVNAWLYKNGSVDEIINTVKSVYGYDRNTNASAI